jgi:hypothetical protein
MKTLHVYVLAALFLAGGISCRPCHEQPATLTGKLVINGPCGNYAVQIISGRYDRSKVLPTWKDTLHNITYTNVFSVANRCTFGEYGVQKDQLFTFLMNDSVIVQDCAVCEIYVALPPVYNMVNGVRPLP